MLSQNTAASPSSSNSPNTTTTTTKGFSPKVRPHPYDSALTLRQLIAVTNNNDSHSPRQQQQQQQQQQASIHNRRRAIRLPERCPSSNSNNFATNTTIQSLVSKAMDEASIESALSRPFEEEEQQGPYKTTTPGSGHTMDSLPVAPWRKDSIPEFAEGDLPSLPSLQPRGTNTTSRSTTTTNNNTPQTQPASGTDSLPRKVSRKPSGSSRDPKQPTNAYSHSDHQQQSKNNHNFFRINNRPRRQVSREGSFGNASGSLLSSFRNRRRLSTRSNESWRGSDHSRQDQDGKVNLHRRSNCTTETNHTNHATVAPARGHHHHHHHHPWTHHDNLEEDAGLTEDTTDQQQDCKNDDDDVEYILETISAHRASKVNLVLVEQDPPDTGSSQKKDRQASLLLDHLLLHGRGSSSRRGSRARFSQSGTAGSHHNNSSNHNSSRRYSKNGSSGHQSSFLSSISSAFSSVRSSIFLFTTTPSARRLAELEGNSMPQLHCEDDYFESDNNHHHGDNDDERQHDYEEPATAAKGDATGDVDAGHEDHGKRPPRFPWRRTSWQSSSSLSSYARSHSSRNLVDGHNKSSSTSSATSGSRRGSSSAGNVPSRADQVPRLPWRQSSKTPGKNQLQIEFDCIEEGDHEIDVSASCHAMNESSCRNPTTRAREQNEDENETKSNRLQRLTRERRSKSDPLLHVGDDDDDDDIDPYAGSFRRQSAPSKVQSPFNQKQQRGEELPFPIRRESIQSMATSKSPSSPVITKVPKSVPPDATTLEKKIFLKQKLHFPKERLGIVLQRAILGNNKKKTDASPKSSQS